MVRWKSAVNTQGRMTALIFCGAIAAMLLASGRTSAQAPAPVQGTPAPAAQPAPTNAMLITGGCCHDYTGQSKILMDTLNAVMPINWTVVHGMTALPNGRLPLYEDPNWARGMDIVIHNECWADGDLPQQVVQNITAAPVPRMFLHCSFHSYRVMTNDAWRELMGGTSRRHTRAHNIAVKWVDGDPITAGLPPFVTPIDELYVIEKEWAPFKALATAVSPEEGNPTFPVVWTREYRGQRVFATTLGHGNETFNTNQFKELVTRGFRWALKKEPIAMPARGGGAARQGGANAPPATAPAGGRGQ